MQPPPRDSGLTLAKYAEAKRLPEEFLRKLGLEDAPYQRATAVRIPYRLESGEEGPVRFRVRLEKNPEGDDRFRWKTGSKTIPYGLWRLERARAAGYVVLVEGESDCHTLWHCDVPALGIPGVTNWRDEWARCLDGIPIVYAIVEPDRGGEFLRTKLAASSLRDRLRLVELDSAKDPSALYLANPEGFRSAFEAALRGSASALKLVAAERDGKHKAAWERCHELAKRPRILDGFLDVLEASGAVGEERVARLIYLAVTSRLLERPVSIAVRGPSSAGKSYTVEQVLRFFPPSAFYALTSMSEHALAYSEESLVHRHLVLYEVSAPSNNDSDLSSYLLRSLLSEGHIRYETVEKTAEGMRARLIERAGPTGLVLTTTAVRLHPENETRLLSVTVDDTPEQTRRILRAQASGGDRDASARRRPDLEPWHALQEWLECSDPRVSVPFAGTLAELVPAVAVRLRRDFPLLLNLIRAHALLHRATRDRDSSRAVVATPEDYAIVRELVADLFGEAVQATVSASVRKTVEAVRALVAAGRASATVDAVAKALKLDKSAASRRVNAARAAGYLQNLEEKRGQPARLVLGDPLPETLELLPSPERLHGCSGAGGGKANASPIFEVEAIEL